jgi:hypothetical protein
MGPNWEQIQAGAVSFARRWAGPHEEISEAQSFVRDFLAVFGIADPLSVGRFEKCAVKGDDAAGRAGTAPDAAGRAGTAPNAAGRAGTAPDAAGRAGTAPDERDGRMDYLWPRRLAVEMKTTGKDLAKAYAQMKAYVLHLPADQMTDMMMVSDFEHIDVYERVSGRVVHFKTNTSLRSKERKLVFYRGAHCVGPPGALSRTPDARGANLFVFPNAPSGTKPWGCLCSPRA